MFIQLRILPRLINECLPGPCNHRNLPGVAFHSLYSSELKSQSPVLCVRTLW
ncbi:hypothetical protein BDV35DRAFT_342568 [Aspergillus flavus]|uniref:Uncharacterized protein n=1 Tax=Aspergillus flavus TaxID=5059 RepID=A0A5N6H8Y7_ASPFL|nr:hypothetical protein BDV35DRAFT_342568 [Aspergillus flavus]